MIILRHSRCMHAKTSVRGSIYVYRFMICFSFCCEKYKCTWKRTNLSTMFICYVDMLCSYTSLFINNLYFNYSITSNIQRSFGVDNYYVYQMNYTAFKLRSNSGFNRFTEAEGSVVEIKKNLIYVQNLHILKNIWKTLL